MNKKVFENLYSFNIMFDEVKSLQPQHDRYNYDIVNNIYIYKDTKKGMVHETEPNNELVTNHINSFLPKFNKKI